MTPRLPLILLLAFVMVGCRKKEAVETAPPPPAVGAAQPEAAAEGNDTAASQPRILMSSQQGDGTAAPVENAVPPLSADPNIAIDQMTQALRKYGAEKQRVPKSLEEVVAAGYLRAIPAAPPGQKYSFDPKMLKVTLVKR